MRQFESSSRLSTNGRAVKIVPTSEVVEDIANGSTQVVNGRNQNSSLVVI